MLELYNHTCPFPSITPEGLLHDGLYLTQPKKCRECPTKSCTGLLTKSQKVDFPTFHTCEFGLSAVLVPAPFGQILLNGILVPEENTGFDARRRKQYKSQKVSKEKICRYCDSIGTSAKGILNAIDQKARDSIAGFHDITTAVNLLFRNAEAILDHQPGDTLDEKVLQLDSPLKTLLFSVWLLSSRLEMATIVANPESASYGQPRPTAVYKTFHRFARLFEQEAIKRNIRIVMTGSSFNKLRLYNSFDTIPLVLIDNAIKYSFDGKDVIVRVDDEGSKCFASIESYGAIIPPQFRDKIFLRGFRTPLAKDTVSSGSGLGLYIASIVANANAFAIDYRAIPERGNPGQGGNVFSFEVSGRQQI
jgi:hypothetical protein